MNIDKLEQANLSAFPCNFEQARVSSGISIRDYFAAKIVGSLMLRYNYDMEDLHDKSEDVESLGEILVDDAYKLADVMLERRKL